MDGLLLGVSCPKEPRAVLIGQGDKDQGGRATLRVCQSRRARPDARDASDAAHMAAALKRRLTDSETVDDV